MSQKKIKLPASDGAKADRLYAVREERLKIQRSIENLAAEEHALKEYFATNLSKSSTTGVAGKRARVQVSTKPVPQVDDWPAFYAHVKKTGNFELMQRRLNEGAVKERWEANKQVPGVGRFNAVSVSCTALKA